MIHEAAHDHRTSRARPPAQVLRCLTVLHGQAQRMRRLQHVADEGSAAKPVAVWRTERSEMEVVPVEDPEVRSPPP